MNIKKLGHCCLLIKEGGLTVLTDPGAYSTSQNQLTGIDVILITHEHADHLHIGSLKAVLVNNPQAEVITNSGVGVILAKEGIAHTIVAEGQRVERKGVEISGFGKDHWKMYKTVNPVENTAYFIGKKLFYPGDSFSTPDQSVDVLALPVAGPWATLSECIDYALAMKPRAAFPVHDGMLIADRLGPAHRLPQQELTKVGIDFVVMNEGDEKTF
ncbi:MAG: MBL fold metallo-hydrolase [Patescibacteria group bacterium]